MTYDLQIISNVYDLCIIKEIKDEVYTPKQ